LGAVTLDGESAAPAPVSAPAAEEEEVHEVEPVERSWTWFQNGGVDIEVGMLLDGPAVMMLFVVTLVSLLVHVYSTDYVAGDRRYTHFFAFLSLFTASMLGLVMAKTTLQLIVCWELVGVCSFALIGHWWEEKANSDAALKAFITNRVGDVGLLVGMITLFFAAGGTFDILDINTQALNGEIDHLALLVASCSLLAAVMSKSGQFILHTWLPDAMAGPTPVSALIHAATMVVAGIYMVGRMYGVFFEGFSIGTSSVNLLAVVGGITVLGGAGLAFVQNDIKKVLAYSTVSQLGYMVMALGIGAWTAAFFHLFTHAFFKACLFLGSGSVSHAVHSFDMKKDMGGLRKWMPQTYRTFLIATAALIGIFPLAGFWSKDEILAGASQLGGPGHYT
ncbi:MAG TPA: NADH-quinone oxidoreductase subunit L, partial [Acidimicrobiales bacterium]|nr:NADH-quinone oxidoreductase subunit L [Acidimicrobiales bacterium]